MRNTQQEFDQDIAYLLAKHKAEKLKRFYVHSIVYVIVNCGLIFAKVYRNMANGETFSEAFFDFSTFSTALIWGLVLAIHAFSIYGPDVMFGKNWEERKIRKFIEEESQNKKY